MRVVTVGGAETGIEVAGEIKSAWPHAEVTMVSRSRCGDFKGARVEKAVRAELKRLGVRLIDDEVVTEVRATRSSPRAVEQSPATSAHGRAGFAQHRSPEPQGLQLTRRIGSGSIPTYDRVLIRTSLPLATPPIRSLRPVRPTDCRPLLRSCQAPMRRMLFWRSGRSGSCTPSASPRSVRESPSAGRRGFLQLSR